MSEDKSKLIEDLEYLILRAENAIRYHKSYKYPDYNSIENYERLITKYEEELKRIKE